MVRRLILRRGLVPLAAVLGLMAGAPAAAMAADTFSVTPCNSGCTPNNTSLTAGGNSSLTMAGTFTGSSPSSVTIKFQPGFLISLSANPACLGTHGAGHPSDCLAGQGTLTVTGPTTFNVNLFLVAPAVPSALAGFDIVCNGGAICGGNGTLLNHGDLSLSQIASGTGAGQVVPQITLLLTSANLGFSLSVNGMLNGQPFTRLPSNCSPALPSSMAVTYAGPTVTSTNASPDISGDSGFAASCPTLPYAPRLAIAAQKDPSDSGVAIQTVISQNAGEAANLNTTLTTPSGTLSPNAAAIPLQCTNPNPTFGNCTQVGSAAADSPLTHALFPNGVPGKVYLTGSGIANIDLTIYFPALNVALVGHDDLGTNSLTFAKSAAAPGCNAAIPGQCALDIPDIPLTSLATNLNGGPQALFTTGCSPASAALQGAFKSQNGKSATASAPFTIVNCAAAPTGPTVTSKSLSGLAKGKPKLKFTATAGSAKIKKIVVKLGGGLLFKGKFAKKQKGFKLSGGKVSSAKIQGGRLVITLRSAVSSATVSLGPPALKETAALKKKAKKKKVKSLAVTVTLTDANNLATAIKLTFKHPR